MNEALPRPRLIASDLDGTLLRDDGRMSARTVAALLAMQAAGIEVVFVTARPPRWVDEVAHAVGDHGVVICLNGAFVYDATQRSVLAEQAMSDGLVRQLTADLRSALPTIAFAAERRGGFATEHRFSGPHPVPDGSPAASMIEDLLDGATGKLLARCVEVPDADLVGLVAEVLADRAIVAYSGAVGLAEISGPGVTKASTLARWAAERGFCPGEVWAFGDMPNDLPMLRWAGRSFAVDNAHPAVRAMADHVCGSNQDDGVAAVLESILSATTGSHRQPPTAPGRAR
ncbi:HAD family hydrolase [Cellulomonas sp. KRMCY2]|uniref:HAD family hydrolase n=1 Tax=Cellulomonas sp. KRMCY2 TaxID=1304865 RepID=UPI0004B7C4C9|nr:HAD family hydrolase [Cellulomonas sp. KRMCY2]